MGLDSSSGKRVGGRMPDREHREGRHWKIVSVTSRSFQVQMLVSLEHQELWDLSAQRVRPSHLGPGSLMFVDNLMFVPHF